MVGWHHWLSGHEFEQTQGDSEGQGSLVCCSHRFGHDLVTEQQQQSIILSIATFVLEFWDFSPEV